MQWSQGANSDTHIPRVAASSLPVLGIHPPLERGQQLWGPAAKLCQGGSLMSSVARPNP